MKRVILIALLVDLLLTLMAVFGFIWVTSSDERWQCFKGYLTERFYAHFYPADAVTPAPRVGQVWLCGQDMQFVGPDPMPGSDLINVRGELE